MKRLITLIVLVLSGSIVSAQPRPPNVVVTFDTFDDRLSPYGAWLVLPGHGRVWQPAMEYVGDGFYPYGSGGHWVYTDEGWVFDSDYPFGWAVFHYGRWMLDPDYGWVWVPGNTWAPAWVSWRMGGSYIGWAPMGPRGAPEFHHNHWLFVETGQLTVINVRSHALDERRFRDAVTITQPVHGAVPIGPPPSYISAATRVQIRAVPVNEVHSSGRAIPPPPPPGMRPPPGPVRMNGAPPPPPPSSPQPGRMEPNRVPPPPSSPQPGRMEPNRLPPPPPSSPQPGRMEPNRVPPPPPSSPQPGRMEPNRAPPSAFQPGRMEPNRMPPPPGRIEPQRSPGPSFAPPPPPPPGQPQPSTTKPKFQGPPPPPPSRRGPR